ncbi:hypothetical protein CFC21_003453 [Triticum aestivum]|uniref:Bifunctional inhibitor/plant lipid transfer protein/seed storage helical domain-containing protein n=2 Tax=Triticum TaxID=4564 RepID=A0A1D5RWD4_WHEAT|nr:non-specific lipid-transfer protein EPAD1-like [Triticum aestivum]XP_044445983.1 non-specific lipid-transfer protein EPAD1-like [Triticum aestivum]XP_044446259.1 non-specific lipid-transfer protein EPAD1-like [Triticum aestivum]XP_044446299.1 non-specific lipid-transfer protein EPAD1-like [Triticum aestivum]VAH09313.1 unnamed protein product [Triticum turgidum subsp. durum]KAF6985608.1 hypothetical protein CFC21_003448 [Triticum aestivum]KAF6985613.1 hypothetical protein CFC21_003453 [Trit
MRAFATAAWVVLLLAAAALVSVSSASASISASVDPSGCNATQLATAIVKNCVEEFEPTNAAACCSSVLPTVDMAGCLCLVVDEPQLALSGTTSQAVFSLYLKCGGKRRSQDKPYEACDDFFATSPPSLPAPASPAPPASPRDMYYPPTPVNEDSSYKIELSTDVGVWVTVIVYLIVMGFAVYERLTRGGNDNEGGQEVNNDQDPEGQGNPRPDGAA